MTERSKNAVFNDMLFIAIFIFSLKGIFVIVIDKITTIKIEEINGMSRAKVRKIIINISHKLTRRINKDFKKIVVFIIFF